MSKKWKFEVMIIHENFSESCHRYENFEIWDIESMSAFFSGNEIINTIFEDEYKFPVAEFNEKRTDIEDTNGEIIEKILDHIGDKHFFVFTLHNPNHLDLIKLQNLKIMNFGVDIEDVKKDHFYVVIMDKKSEN